MKRRLLLALVGLALLLTVSAALAQGGYTLGGAIFGGGGNSAGGRYSLQASVGQPAIGATMHGGSYTLDGGFFGVGASGDLTKSVYLPLLQR